MDSEWPALCQHHHQDQQRADGGGGALDGVTTIISYDNASGHGNRLYTHSDRGRLASVSGGPGTVSYLHNLLEERVVKSGAQIPDAPMASG